MKRHSRKWRKHVQRAYTQHFESKIIPYFGDKLIRHISATDLMDWQNELLEQFKATSVKKYRTVFYGILEDARKELANGKKLIRENPFKVVDTPKEVEVFINDTVWTQLIMLSSTKPLKQEKTGENTRLLRRY